MSNRIYSKRRNPNWLMRLARWIGRQRRQFNLYRFYRGLGHAHGEAWDKAERTL
jgi:hypothetical protein